MIIIYNRITGLFHTSNKEAAKLGKQRRNNNQTLTKWIARSKFNRHLSNKAKFIQWVVYTANVALMVE